MAVQLEREGSQRPLVADSDSTSAVLEDVPMDREPEEACGCSNGTKHDVQEKGTQSQGVSPDHNHTCSSFEQHSKQTFPGRPITADGSLSPVLSPSPPPPPRRKRCVDLDTYVDLDAPPTPEEGEVEEEEAWLAKRPKVPVRDGVLLCLRISEDIGSASTPAEVARELARCLHEPKYELLKDVVRVLGVEKALEIFFKTSEIQEEGGQVTLDDSNKKKTPGGVFLTMVKNRATEKERTEIFKREKDNWAKKQREFKRKRRQIKKKMIQEKAQRQLELFRAQLLPTDGLLPVTPGSRKDRNMHKRLHGPDAKSEDPQGDDAREPERDALGRLQSCDMEAMEVDPSPQYPSQNKVALGRSEVKRNDRDVIQKEERLAEEFEQLEDCDFVDCGLELV